jgi:hypothetical protein
MRPRTSTRIASALVTLFGVVAAQAGAAPDEVGRQILAATGISEKQIRSLGDQVLVVELPVPDSSRQASFAGLMRVTQGYKTLFSPERTGDAPALLTPKLFGTFVAPAQTEDLAALELPPDDFTVLEECEPAACRFKLDSSGIEFTRTLDWNHTSAPGDFLAWFRDALDRNVRQYRSQGLAGLITYADKPQPFAVATGVKQLEQQSAVLLGLHPGIKAYLGSYPGGKPEGVTDRIVWTVSDFGYRPTLSVDHSIVAESSSSPGIGSAMVLRTLYANHYLAGRLQLGAVIDGDQVFGVPGHYVLTLDQMLFDDELGRVKRGLLARGLKTNVSDRLKGLRARTSAGL